MAKRSALILVLYFKHEVKDSHYTTTCASKAFQLNVTLITELPKVLLILNINILKNIENTISINVEITLNLR